MSPEKYDMNLPEQGSRTARQEMTRHQAHTHSAPQPLRTARTQAAPLPRPRPLDRPADIAAHRALRPAGEPRLRCVASGYMSGGCSCPASIPASVVSAAWAHERRAGVCGEHFFHFSWCGEIWLGYGLADGEVRGVYCPPHAAQRDERSAQSKVAALTLAAPRPSAFAARA